MTTHTPFPTLAGTRDSRRLRMASARGLTPTGNAPARRRQTSANDDFLEDEGMSLWFDELRDRLRLWSAYGCVGLAVFLMLYFAAQELLR
jgi:hypothetical protein